MTTTFTSQTYRSLSGSETRLIHIEATNQDDPIRCNLEYVLLDNRPSYFALSYTWGDEKKEKKILLDGQPFLVTANLHAVLEQICEWPAREELHETANVKPDSRFWIDAICVNQTDLAEKSEQVPRMGQIYANAERVLAYLGPNEEQEAGMVSQVFQLADRIGYLYKQPEVGLASIPLFTSWLTDESGFDLEELSGCLISIIKRPWFSRIWVVQESVLAKDHTIIIAGDATTNIHYLYILWIALRMYMKDPFVRHSLISGSAVAVFHSLKLVVQDPDWHISDVGSNLKTYASQLCNLINATSSQFKSTLPHDMIYGMLGLVDFPQSLPSELKPNYEASFSSVYQNYTRFLIENTGNFSIMPTVENHLVGVPSWVLDFREKRFGATGLQITPPTLASATFSDDGSQMTLEGVKLSTCTSVFRLTPTCADSVEVFLAILPHFEEAILRKASRLGNASCNDTLRTWLNYLLKSSHYAEFEPLSDEFYNIFNVLANREPYTSPLIDTTNNATGSQVPEGAAGEPGPEKCGDQEDSNIEICDRLYNTTIDEKEIHPEAESSTANSALSQLPKELVDETELGGSTHGETEDANSIDMNKIALISLLRSTLAEVSHFVTSNGTIGMLMRGDELPKDEDTVYVFKGSVYASLLRPSEEGGYLFVGGVRLCNEINETQYDDDWFSQRQIDYVTLI